MSNSAIDIHHMLCEFHSIFVPKGMDVRSVRAKLLNEEHVELQEALASGKRAAIAQELADLVYVAFGIALVYEIDLGYAIELLHASNMSKLGIDGKPILREDGKVLKGPNFKAADFRGALIEPIGYPIRENADQLT